MKVKVHPHKTMVNAGVEACISITPARARAHAYYMGTVALSDVTFTVQAAGLKRAREEQRRNVHALAVGDLKFEYTEQYEPSPVLAANLVKVTYHYNVGRFLTVNSDPNKVVDVTDGHFKAAYICGRDFYVSKF